MAIYKRVAGNLIIESIGAANTVTFQNTTGVANVVITGDLSVSGNASLTGNISGDKLFQPPGNKLVSTGASLKPALRMSTEV